MRITGQASHWEVAGDSGNVKIHAFCPVCGTPVYLRFAAMPELIAVPATSLDEPGRFAFNLVEAKLWRRFGWRGWYFRALAGRVYEPFLAAWQKTDHAQWFASNGFELIEDEDHMPWRLLVARRR